MRILTEVLAMECKPFNIHVMLVTPASVASAIMGKHTEFSLPTASIYGSFFHNIIERVRTSESSGKAMPGDVFADDIIAKAVGNTPPRYVLSGGNSMLFRIAAYFPRWLYLDLVWKRFSKPENKIKSKSLLILLLYL